MVYGSYCNANNTLNNFLRTFLEEACDKVTGITLCLCPFLYIVPFFGISQTRFSLLLIHDAGLWLIHSLSFSLSFSWMVCCFFSLLSRCIVKLMLFTFHRRARQNEFFNEIAADSLPILNFFFNLSRSVSVDWRTIERWTVYDIHQILNGCMHFSYVYKSERKLDKKSFTHNI